MLSNLKLALIAAALAVCLGFGIRWHFDRVDYLQDQIDVLEDTAKSNKAALAIKDKAMKGLQKQYQIKNKELSDAITHNPDWANTPVPDAVYDSLYQRSKG